MGKLLETVAHATATGVVVAGVSLALAELCSLLSFPYNVIACAVTGVAILVGLSYVATRIGAGPGAELAKAVAAAGAAIIVYSVAGALASALK